MAMNINDLATYDPEIANAIQAELQRQRNKIELIASENNASPSVMAAMGTVLTNKYAEGYPGKRYYGGCENVDVVENLARERACELFGCEHANVQPHCGANANLAVYFAFLNPGDTIMGMNLSEGGHLSHGSPVNISGKWMKVVPYGVNAKTERIDYDALEKVAREVNPKIIVGGASAYPRIIDFERMASIAHGVGALLMVDIAHIAGLVATGLHPSPIPFADVVTTTTHKTLRGPRGGMILCKKKYAQVIDKAVFPGTQGGPLMHIIAAKAVALKEALDPSFKIYQQGILDNAQALAKALVEENIRLVSGGTDNHLVLMDVRRQGLTGKMAEKLMDDAGLTANKNTIPNDPQSPFVTSGVRLGTAAITTRGFKEEDAAEVGHIIGMILNRPDDAAVQADARKRVKALTDKYPMYAGLQYVAGR